jgi:hypothetical protein
MLVADAMYNAYTDTRMHTMKLEIPFVINEAPTKAHWKTKYPDNGFQAKLAFASAKKVYMRVCLAEAQNWRCCWCGVECVPESDKKNSATIEHVTPRSQGGTDHWSNLAMSCNRCNQARGVRPIERFIDIVQKGSFKEYSKADHRAAKAAAIRKLQQQVRSAVAANNGNPFELNSKEFKMFERYVASDKLNMYKYANRVAEAA